MVGGGFTVNAFLQSQDLLPAAIVLAGAAVEAAVTRGDRARGLAVLGSPPLRNVPRAARARDTRLAGEAQMAAARAEEALSSLAPAAEALEDMVRPWARGQRFRRGAAERAGCGADAGVCRRTSVLRRVCACASVWRARARGGLLVDTRTRGQPSACEAAPGPRTRAWP